MKRLLSLIALSLLAITVSARAETGSTADSDFDAANTLYAQGKFTEAAAVYEKAIHSGSISSAIYFNLGNAFYKSGQIGHAVAAYRQAAQISPRDPDIRANLNFVRGQIQGPVLPTTHWQRWLDRLTLNEWTFIASAALWILLLLLAAIQFRPALKSALRSLTLVSGVATVAAIFCLISVISDRSTPLAIVSVPEAMVRNGPFDEFQSVFTVNNGAELAVIDQKNDWLQVRADERKVGWIKRSEVLLAPGKI